MLAARWADGTPLPALADRLDRLQDPDANMVAALIRPILADAEWLAPCVHRLLRAVYDDPFLDVPLAPISSGVQSGLLLYRGPHAAIFAGVGARDALAAKRMRPRRGTIVVPGHHGLMRVLSASDALLSLWRGGWTENGLSPRCEAAGSIRLAARELVEIDGRTTGFVVEHLRGDLVTLQATIFAGAAPTSCEYDAASLALVGSGAALEDASRTQMLATLLGEIDLPDPIAFDAASRRGEPFVRWHVMRAWVTSDARGARARLAEMAAADADADLRGGLARETLELVDARCRA